MWLVNLFIIRWASHAAAALLSVFLLVLLIRKRKRTLDDWLLAALAAAATAWQSALGIQHYLAVAGREAAHLPAALETLCTASAVLAPAILLHLASMWAKFPRYVTHGLCLLLYPAAVLVWWAVPGHGAWLFALAVGLSAASLLYAAPQAAHPYPRFFRWMAVSLAALAAAAPAGPTLLAAASLAATVCLLRFIYTVHVFDLFISRRVLFVFTLATVSAVYLLLVRAVASWIETRMETFGPLVEVCLVLGAAVTWLPLYEVITRFFSRQNRLYADFSKRVIEEAASILDLRSRMQYLAGQVGRTFRLRSAMIVLRDDPSCAVSYPSDTERLDTPALENLAAWLERQSPDPVHLQRLSRDEEGFNLLAASGFNYLFPLRYQDRLTGMLLADTAPRAFLDEDETTLLGLSREISLSIESCRLAESKIGLERELLRQQHLATLGKAAATIAHEVKNPLSSIKTLAQLMHEDPAVLPRYGRDLDYLISETDRLNSTVQQLLTFARPLPEPAEAVELSELLESAAAFLARESRHRNIRIERRIAPGLHLANAGRQTVNQVVLNLLLNALQASPDGGRVELEATRDSGSRIRLSVTDEGPGIPPENCERIFEPFFTTRQQGTGLGLAIVQKNVQQLGGEIEVHSPVADGHGARMTVSFPADRGA